MPARNREGDRIRRLAVLTAILPLLTGCEPKQNEYGHLAVRSLFNIHPKDVFLYRSTMFGPDAAGNLDVIETEPPGDEILYLLRNNQKYRLCPVELKRDRVVAVTLDQQRRPFSLRDRILRTLNPG